MRKLILGAFLASVALGAGAQDVDPYWSTSLTASIAFGGRLHTSGEDMQFGATLGYGDNVLGQAVNAPALLNVQFAPQQGFLTSIVGQPVVAYRLSASDVEGERGWVAKNWKTIALGGAAVVGLALAGGGGSGGDANKQSRDCVSDETVVGTPDETADLPEVGDCGSSVSAGPGSGG